MDVTLIANFLLFLGALGASFSSSSDSGSAEDESLYDRDDYSDSRRGGSGDDRVTADRDNLAWFMGDGDDTVEGSSADDYADLGRGDDSAAMGAGNDIVEAGTGGDSISGGNGNDIALGGEGNDSLSGDLGDDRLGGEAGMDWLTGGTGNDILSGGEGNDVLSGFGPDGGAASLMTGSDGVDQLFGGTGDDRLILGRGDVGTGGTGEDRFEMDARWRDGTGLFRINDFDAEEDSLVLRYAPSIDPNTSLPLTPEITTQTSADGTSTLVLMNGTVIAQLDGVTGLSPDAITLEPDTQTDTGYRPGQYDSELTGTDGADSQSGGTGDDYGRMGAGDDTALGGAGHDSLLGEAGNDSLMGEAGNDTLHGGDGQDRLDGGIGNDIVTGGLGNDVVTGGAGADQVQGGGGDDTVSGYNATAGGEDSLTATDGADSLSGGDGNDLVIIGRGDVAHGGTGTDTFLLDARWDESTVVATISDFVRGTDRIELEYTAALDGSGNPITPTLAVLMGPSNAYAVITLDGDPVAHVTGATTLTVADITLIRAATA